MAQLAKQVQATSAII